MHRAAELVGRDIPDNLANGDGITHRDNGPCGRSHVLLQGDEHPLGTRRFLAERGAAVTVTDMKGEAELGPYLKMLAGLDINYELGRHDRHTFLMADLIVVSPGVPMEIAPLLLARAQRHEVISEIELASWFCPARVILYPGTARTE